MPAGNLAAYSSIAFIASPLDTPGAGAPCMFIDGTPLNRSSRAGPVTHSVVEKADRGAMTPLLPRTCSAPIESGVVRNGASACTNTRFTRSRSMKSLT